MHWLHADLILIVETCDNEGRKIQYNREAAQFPVPVAASEKCTSLNFLADFDRNAGFRFDITIDLDKLR